MAVELQSITELVRTIGRVSDVGPDEDFYEAGFSSVSSLELLMELESRFEVSIPDDRFIAARSVRALSEMVAGLKTEQL